MKALKTFGGILTALIGLAILALFIGFFSLTIALCLVLAIAGVAQHRKDPFGCGLGVAGAHTGVGRGPGVRPGSGYCHARNAAAYAGDTGNGVQGVGEGKGTASNAARSRSFMPRRGP